MGLTNRSSGFSVINTTQLFNADPVIALAGNPNTGKSTVFNALTGLTQHTGNWPGKTVVSAQGSFIYNGSRFNLVDLPGTYSLMANSEEEVIARDFLCFSRPDACIVVTDATCMERNLNLVLQILEVLPTTLVCVNLMDEARRKQIKVDIHKLQQLLGVPVVSTAATQGKGLSELKKAVYRLIKGDVIPSPLKINYPPELETAIKQISPMLKEAKINPRWAALRMLEEEGFFPQLDQYLKTSDPRAAF